MKTGLAGICDRNQYLCLAIALWNGNDPILKERLFGLTGPEGNHGEDVKEYYFYLDSTPTHSYMKMLYKYPQAAFPYGQLVEENRWRGYDDDEYELLDTGVFDENRYFDVVVEYAKADENDILARVTVTNRGPEGARFHLMPTLWYRNTWSWGYENGPLGDVGKQPRLSRKAGPNGTLTLSAEHPVLGPYNFWVEDAREILFTENDSNSALLFGMPNRTPYVKDAFHRFVINGEHEAVNQAGPGHESGGSLLRHCSRRRHTSLPLAFIQYEPPSTVLAEGSTERFASASPIQTSFTGPYRKRG